MGESSRLVNQDCAWKFVSWGIVTKHNLAGDDTIEFWPVSLLPFEEGSVADNNEDETIELVDINGVKRKVINERKAKLEAKWYCTQDGRQTPPNVTDGETVEIYQYGSDDVYYWISNGRQPEIRRLEHVTYAYSNLPTGREGYKIDSSYGWTYSTREKYVRIWTSKSNGEKFAYDNVIDTEASTVRYRDDAGNMFGINSEEQEVFLQNSVNSYLRIFDHHMFGWAQQLVCFRSNRIRMNTPSFSVGGGSPCSRNGDDEEWRRYTHVFADQQKVLASIGNRNPGNASLLRAMAFSVPSGAIDRGYYLKNTKTLPDYPIPLGGEGGLPDGQDCYSQYDHEDMLHHSTKSIASVSPEISSMSKYRTDTTEEYTRNTNTETLNSETVTRTVTKTEVEEIGVSSVTKVPQKVYQGNVHVTGGINSLFYSYSGGELTVQVPKLEEDRDRMQEVLEQLIQRIQTLEQKDQEKEQRIQRLEQQIGQLQNMRP